MAHILVADDDEDIRALVEMMLTQDGHTVVTAEDGMKAGMIFRRDKFDLVITDIIMPSQDGIEFIASILTSFVSEDTPIIAMSGGRRKITSDFNLSSAQTMGVTATLKKPFSHLDLRKAVREALDKKNAPSTKPKTRMAMDL